MQRHAALDTIHPGDLGPAEAPRAVDADAFGAEAPSRLHGAFHGAAEGDAAFELLGRSGSAQGSRRTRVSYLDDVMVKSALVIELTSWQLLDVGALLADDDARRPNGS